MKTFISLMLGAIILITLSISTQAETATKTPQQIILHSSNLTVLSKDINKYFVKGYVVKHCTTQSVSTSLSGNMNRSSELKGEILVIMQKN